MSTRSDEVRGEGPEQRALAALGLLPYLGSLALTDEYAQATRAKHAKGASPAWLIVGMIALAVIVVVAASQTAANSGADAEQRNDLIEQIHQRKTTMRNITDQVTALQREINTLESGLATNSRLSSTTRSRLASRGIMAGTSAVAGPGVVVTVASAPASVGPRGIIQDHDLQQLANGLWQAGAEAMAINGQRITNVTAIRAAGSAITVNYQSLTPPYVVEAIGDPATLPARFAATDSGAAWLDLQNEIGMMFSMNTKSVVRLGPATVPTLRFARPEATANQSGGATR